jgi:ankyrin repeat protein
LQAAKHDKGKVLEAHISLLKDAERQQKLDAADENGRTCAVFAAYYGNLDALELLAASDATFHTVDKFGRTCLHYASM